MGDVLTAIFGLSLGLWPAAWLVLRAIKSWCAQTERELSEHW